MSTVASEKPVILVDGSSYLFRAYYAMPELTNSQGLPTGAMYGVLNMLRKLQSDYEPDSMAVIFDPKGPTFRKKLYAEYKANRDEMPEDLAVQIQPLHDAIRAQGYSLIVEEGVEADDVIGTLVTTLKKQGRTVLVSTGDKDMAQLVCDGVTLINTMNNQVMDDAGVKEKFGVTPDQLIDYLALIGDTSDNVPGVPKVGPKTAAKWLAEYGSLDAIVKNANAIKGRVGESLRDSLEFLPLGKALVTIKCDVPIKETVEDLKLSVPDKAALKTIFEAMEFRKWSAALDVHTEPGEADPAIPSVDTAQEYTTILNAENWASWLLRLKEAPVFAFDTETTSLDAMSAELVGMSFAIEEGQSVYLPLAHNYPGAPDQLDKQKVLSDLEPIFQDSNKIIVGQNLKYDLKIMKNAGLEVATKLWDTMLASFVLNNTKNRHDMNTLAKIFLGRSAISYETVAGKGVKQITFDQVSIEDATRYAAEDAEITLCLYHHFSKELERDLNQKKLFETIEMPLMQVLFEMEYYGVLLDTDLLKKQSKLLERRIADLQKTIFQEAGEAFNIASPKQLQSILYERLKLPILKKTPKGQPSTAENVLQELAIDHDLPKCILEYRSYAKLKSTYTDRLPEQVNPRTHRVHTSYHQIVTSTGRLSSSDPNLQNIPIKTEEGRKIRQAFIAPEGRVIFSADYSQVELRIMAHLSQDPGLLKAFEKGWDIHAATASEVFGVSLENVSKEERRSAKAVNFGLIYGMSAFGLSQQLGIHRGEAQRYIDTYFERYPGVYAYMESVRESAAKQGYVETLMGRKLYIPEIQSKNGPRRKAAERAAINAPLQGTAADIIKVAMIRLREKFKAHEWDVVMLMQVHDELVFEVLEKDLDAVKAAVEQEMQSAATLSVPLLVTTKVGSSWS